MEKKPPLPVYFRTKKWILVITSMIGVWLFYNYADMVIDIVNSKEFKSDLGHALAEETPNELKTIKVFFDNIYQLPHFVTLTFNTLFTLF